MKNDGSRTHPPQGCGRGCDIGGIGLGEGDGDFPGILPPIPTPGMLWVAPQERSVNVPASNTSNTIFRRIISALHGRRLGLTEEVDASVTGRVAALCKDANLRRFT